MKQIIHSESEGAWFNSAIGWVKSPVFATRYAVETLPPMPETIGDDAKPVDEVTIQ